MKTGSASSRRSAETRRPPISVDRCSHVWSVVDYKIAGLEIGADDYIVKPFNQGELVARIRAVLRRTKPKDQITGLIDDGALKLYLDQHRVELDKKPLDLSPKEFDLLAARRAIQEHQS